VTNPVSPLSGLSGAVSAAGNAAAKADGVRLGRQFSDFLNEAMAKLAADQQRVGELQEQFAAGQLPDVHNLLIEAEKAALNLELTVHIRNKVIEAYQEIMRIQV